MKEKLFVDTDVVLDIALRREPFFQSSIRILSLIETRAADGYILTRNVKDYAKAQIKVNTPEEYLNSKNSTRIR